MSTMQSIGSLKQPEENMQDKLKLITSNDQILIITTFLLQIQTPLIQTIQMLFVIIPSSIVMIKLVICCNNNTLRRTAVLQEHLITLTAIINLQKQLLVLSILVTIMMHMGISN